MKISIEKAILQKQLTKIEKKERLELIKKYLPEFKKLEGKYFKFRSGYGGDYKKWWVYTKVLLITADDLYEGGGDTPCLSRLTGWRFQTDAFSVFTVAKNCDGYVHLLGEEITEHEFNTAWNAAMDSLNNLK